MEVLMPKYSEKARWCIQRTHSFSEYWSLLTIAHFLKRVGSVGVTSPSPWQGLALLYSSLPGCSGLPAQGPAAWLRLLWAIASFTPGSTRFFCWACLEPVHRGLKSSLSGHRSFFLVRLGCPQSTAAEAWKFPRLLPCLGHLGRKEKSPPSEDSLALKSPCGLGAYDKFSLRPFSRAKDSSQCILPGLCWCSSSPSNSKWKKETES